MSRRETRMPAQSFMGYPFRIGMNGAERVSRLRHIRDQVEQVLFTSPGERVFRPEYGFGARRFVFEPNRAQVWEIARNRLMASLAEALAGEVDPKTLKVDVGMSPDKPEQLLVQISYVIAALHKEEHHEFLV
ncbi:GPW/gp25 family protein [Palleronia caenipelagi]|uniref:GPW/gp25 family protein n=1 Tax=Palleronia caenipelagi TaxID=2489174 RepID=A0A547PPQ4_9RHOB|nr:GPW/gp25 family protein [Palleronia caenipelagi]TRD16107.1 GPW/gp25 family protein [Palleronia caenipelagi]